MANPLLTFDMTVSLLKKASQLLTAFDTGSMIIGVGFYEDARASAAEPSFLDVRLEVRRRDSELGVGDTGDLDLIDHDQLISRSRLPLELYEVEELIRMAVDRSPVPIENLKDALVLKIQRIS